MMNYALTMMNFVGAFGALSRQIADELNPANPGVLAGVLAEYTGLNGFAEGPASKPVVSYWREPEQVEKAKKMSPLDKALDDLKLGKAALNQCKKTKVRWQMYHCVQSVAEKINDAGEEVPDIDREDLQLHFEPRFSDAEVERLQRWLAKDEKQVRKKREKVCKVAGKVKGDDDALHPESWKAHSKRDEMPAELRAIW